MKRKSHYGFSLVEMAIALGVLSIALLSVFSLLTVGVQNNKISADESFAASGLTALAADLRNTYPTASGRSQIFNLSLPYAVSASGNVILNSLIAKFKTFQIAFETWIWLYAKNVLHISRMETGMLMSWGIVVSIVMAFPCAWLIDRISPYKLLPCLCVIAWLAMWFALHITKPIDLIVIAGLAAILSSLYGASDIMVYRNAHPAEIGSVTSTNSCIRGFYGGCIALLLGFVIEKSGGHYEYAFIVGFIMTFLGLIPLFLYRRLMRVRLDSEAPSEIVLIH